MNAVYVLWIRQITHYLRAPARIIGIVGQSLLFLLAIGLGFGPIFAKAGEGNFIQFLAPGAIALGIIFTGVLAGYEIIFDRQFGFLKETLVAPASRWSIMVGRSLGGATVGFIQGVITLFLSTFVGFTINNFRLLPLAFVYMFLIALFTTSLGTMAALLLTDAQAFQLIINFIVLPLFFVSGSLFPLEQLPRGLTIIALLNPLSYGIDGLRGSLVSYPRFGFINDFAVLLLVSLILLLIGTIIFTEIED
ncbi:MAG: ABC transporter permease [Patescibacteria group bacterium]|nr:ABC transporter permease [Patescibacteria group bacterium]